MTPEWRPGASADALKQRAQLLGRIRAFFSDRLVMEVDTPALATAGVTAPHLASLTTHCSLPEAGCARTLYLQTSPEYAMKRLLAADSGPIYQICKAFRDAEAGRLHNPEFTLLEWYRPGFDYLDMMAEVEELLHYTLGCHYCDRLTYTDAFRRYVALDPLRATSSEIEAAAVRAGLSVNTEAGLDRDGWLDLILTHKIAPTLGIDRPVFLCHYPASQAALARLVPFADPPVAERFEVFIAGVEIANGCCELTDPSEQRQRFAADNDRRKAIGLPVIPIDERLLGALQAGLPECAGVALGIERLQMVMNGSSRIEDILTFDIARA